MAFDLEVVNLPPQLSVDQAVISVDEGQQATNSGTFSDASLNDVVTLSASIGTVVDTGNGTWTWTYDTTDGPGESQVVTVTATDSDGGMTTIEFTLDVANVAPPMTVDRPGPGAGRDHGHERRHLFRPWGRRGGLHGLGWSGDGPRGRHVELVLGHDVDQGVANRDDYDYG